MITCLQFCIFFRVIFLFNHTCDEPFLHPETVFHHMTDYSFSQSVIHSCVYVFYVKYHDFPLSNSKNILPCRLFGPTCNLENRTNLKIKIIDARICNTSVIPR